jgi:hypothetical protein
MSVTERSAPQFQEVFVLCGGYLPLMELDSWTYAVFVTFSIHFVTMISMDLRICICVRSVFLIDERMAKTCFVYEAHHVSAN